ncbi:MAG: hypothetical protein FGM61_12665 [Sediminibacterium sp.]|nr:hypothetical protein [Sediminibacterium sp.]
MQPSKRDNSIIELINQAHKERVGIKSSSSFHSFDERLYEFRKKAIELYNIKADTSNTKSFIVIDWINYEGNDYYGEIIEGESRFFYKASAKKGDVVVKNNSPVTSELTIMRYLKDHRFNELENFAKEKGKNLSGSNFICIGMFEKGMKNIYVCVIPAFMGE